MSSISSAHITSGPYSFDNGLCSIIFFIEGFPNLGYGITKHLGRTFRPHPFAFSLARRGQPACAYGAFFLRSGVAGFSRDSKTAPPREQSPALGGFAPRLSTRTDTRLTASGQLTEPQKSDAGFESRRLIARPRPAYRKPTRAPPRRPYERRRARFLETQKRFLLNGLRPVPW